MPGQLPADWVPHAELYDARGFTLVELSQAEESLGPIVGYQRRLLEVIGSAPRFDTCVKCSRAGDLTHFSAFGGGMIGGRWEPSQVEKREVSAPTLRALCGKTPPASFVGPFRLLNYHISHLMGREPLLAAKLLPVRRRRRAK